jgi:hypothetical protein
MQPRVRSPQARNGAGLEPTAAASDAVSVTAGVAVKPAPPSYQSEPETAPVIAPARSSSAAPAPSSSASDVPSASAAFALPGPRPSEDALMSVARVLHRHILLSQSERDAALQVSKGGWTGNLSGSSSNYGSTRSTPRLPPHSRLGTPLRSAFDSPGWGTPLHGQGPGTNGANSSRALSLGSPGFGSPYSSLSTPPTMPLDARCLGARGLHPNDVDIFDIDHYLSRSYSVQVPLLARVAPVSLFEQRRQYHSVPSPPTVRHVWFLLRRLCSQAHLHAECAIIALIYVERLMETRGLVVTPRNWIVVLVTALLSASKVWDDHASFLNADIPLILPIFTLRDVNAMERSFLSCISYELYISAESYSQYFYGLKSIQGIRNTRDIPRWSVQRSECRVPRDSWFSLIRCTHLCLLCVRVVGIMLLAWATSACRRRLQLWLAVEPSLRALPQQWLPAQLPPPLVQSCQSCVLSNHRRARLLMQLRPAASLEAQAELRVLREQHDAVENARSRIMDVEI